MVYFGHLRPGIRAEGLRQEVDLSPERMRHVSWLISAGMMNHDYIRRMLSREYCLSR